MMSVMKWGTRHPGFLASGQVRQSLGDKASSRYFLTLPGLLPGLRMDRWTRSELEPERLVDRFLNCVEALLAQEKASEWERSYYLLR